MDIGIKKAMNGYLGRQDASKGVSKIVLPFLRQDHSHSALLTLLFNEHVTVPPRLLLKFLDHIATYTARRLLHQPVVYRIAVAFSLDFFTDGKSYCA